MIHHTQSGDKRDQTIICVVCLIALILYVFVLLIVVHTCNKGEVMPIERCIRCGRMIDVDWHAEDIQYINNVPVCCNCWTDAERKTIEEESK